MHRNEYENTSVFEWGKARKIHMKGSYQFGFERTNEFGVNVTANISDCMSAVWDTRISANTDQYGTMPRF